MDREPAMIAGAAGASVEQQRADAAAQIQKTLKVWRKGAGQADPEAEPEKGAVDGERAEGQQVKEDPGAKPEKEAVDGEKAEGQQVKGDPSAKPVVCDGDMIQITLNPPCVAPTLVAPIPLVASGIEKVGDRAVCMVGDEYPPMLRSSPVQYISAGFVGGMGKINITLGSDNKTSDSWLLKGGVFDVKLVVQQPAIMPGSGVPDPQQIYTGTGQFITSNG
jgi:hypothetical protein